jgi:hypothetical protein
MVLLGRSLLVGHEKLHQAAVDQDWMTFCDGHHSRHHHVELLIGGGGK